jgi:biopolymer transport protein ExbB
MNSGYLIFAALMMAGLDGIKNQIDPGEPSDKDLYDLPPEELAKVPQVPGSLDEALLAELPRLERGQALVKLLAAVAPLLGLLGTVTGMIGTFQSITVFGTGDPQLMAGGISQALVTTVLGLITAVPLMLAHTALSSRSRWLSGLIEGRASAALAEHLEALPASAQHRESRHAASLA